MYWEYRLAFVLGLISVKTKAHTVTKFRY